MKSYCLNLTNKNINLDLIKKTTQINNCLDAIIKKGKGLISYNINKISKYSIVLTVEEGDKWWHQTFGKNLANDYGMREYCCSRDSTKMFEWS